MGLPHGGRSSGQPVILEKGLTNHGWYPESGSVQNLSHIWDKLLFITVAIDLTRTR